MPGSEIEISVNGQPRRLPAQTSLLGLLALLRLEPSSVAVERNGEVVPRREHGNVTLCGGDVLEVVTFVGGG